MIRSFRFIRGAILLAALVAALTVASQAAVAQSKPFKIGGAGIAPDGIPFPGHTAPHLAVGEGTFLGKYSSAGGVQNDSIEFSEDGDATGTFQSDGLYVFMGANGDQLAVHYGSPLYGPHGTYDLFYLSGRVGPGGTYVAFFVADFVPDGSQSTGKFKGVSGSWTMYAETEPFVLGSTDPVAYTWEGEGRLTFSREK